MCCIAWELRTAMSDFQCMSVTCWEMSSEDFQRLINQAWALVRPVVGRQGRKETVRI